MSSWFSVENIKNLLFWIPVILLSISFHEYAHGWVAYKMGDMTAKAEGRLTLNPVKHFNLIGFLMMVIVHFGWATPVPVNPNNFKNPRKGMLITALAGPCANMILALTGTFLYTLVYYIAYFQQNTASEFVIGIFQNTLTLLLYLIYINLGLAIFNLIPVYPLDGSRILGYFMPSKYHAFMAKYGQYIQIAFMFLIIGTSFVGNIIAVVQTRLADFLIGLWANLFGIILQLF